MRGKSMLSNSRKAHIYTKDVFEANILDDEDDVIFLKKGAMFMDSPQSIMHNIVPDMEPMKLPEALISPVKETSGPQEDDKDDLDLEKSLMSAARLPIKLSGGEVGVHSRMARYEKNKARSLSKKYWARKRAAKQAVRDDVEAVEDDGVEEQWAPPVRTSSKGREKARRADRRSARDAKCASWYDNEVETVSFEVPEERPETRFILIDRPVIYVPVVPTADPVFQELIAEDRVISVPRIPVKIGGTDEIGMHSRMARREKNNARKLSKKHWGRVRAAKRAARADHEARFAEEEEADAEYWPLAPQYTQAGVKARRIDRRAARDAKCTSWCENELETVVFAAKPKAKAAKVDRPWVSRTELPASVQVVDPEFKALVVNEMHTAVEAELHCRMAKRGKKHARELYKKFWSKKREAKAAHAKFEASLPADDESEEENAPPPPIRSGTKIREKARRAARRDARDAKCAAWDDDESAGHEVFPNKGWLQEMPEKVGMRDVMYEDASSEASEAASPVSTIVNASRMTQVSRARLKLSFGEAIRSKPISSIRKAHETGRKAHRRNIVETARAA